MGVDIDLKSLEKDIRNGMSVANTKVAALERKVTELERDKATQRESLDDLYRKIGRPGAYNGGGGADLERKSAAEMCVYKHALMHPKNERWSAYEPAPSEIEEGIIARKAIYEFIHHGDIERFGVEERKSLSSFNFGGLGWITPPEWSNQILSCLEESFDVASLVHKETIGGPSIRFPIDNAIAGRAAWACESNCFANAPGAHLANGLGELEIKAESLRYIACATNDIMEDSGINLERFLIGKVSMAFRETISEAILCGDGLGKPQGLLSSGAIPVCDVAASTPAGQFNWRDLVMLAFEVPIQWHRGAVFLMNQRTFALLKTMTDAMNRPLMEPVPMMVAGTTGGQEAGVMPHALLGYRVIIVPQLPDCQPGACPILFGNLDRTYTLVTRKGVTMQRDPYSASFCTLFRWESRVGGAITCANAARLLRIG